MAIRAKKKLWLIDAISQYHKQQPGQIGQTNNTRKKGTKPLKHLLQQIEDNSRRTKYKIRKSSNNEEIRLEKNSQR